MGKFDGAWEENSVKGPRVEIDGNKLTRLWMAAPVLETSFTTCEQDGKIVFNLEHDGLRNAGSLDPYAVIKECYYDGTALVFVDDYRFSGISETRLFPTSNSRYGSVTLVDSEILPALQGRWESKYTDLTFNGNKVGICGHGAEIADISIEIVTARANGCDSGDVKILDKDPAKQGIGDYYSLCYSEGSITGWIQVCDAEPMKINFTKKA
jgi:hypothetical protein